jgi:hypothetical protein
MADVSRTLAGQAVGITEVDDGIWLVSCLHDDLGYIDIEEKSLRPLPNPFGPKVLPMSPGQTNVSLTSLIAASWNPLVRKLRSYLLFLPECRYSTSDSFGEHK